MLCPVVERTISDIAGLGIEYLTRQWNDSDTNTA